CRVSDAAGPGAGRVVRVAHGAATDLIPGLDYAAGLALDGPTLLVGNLDGSLVGSVRKYDLDGMPAGTLVGGLSGSYAVVVDGDGLVLVSGGFTDNTCTNSTVIALDAPRTRTTPTRAFASSAA